MSTSARFFALLFSLIAAVFGAIPASAEAQSSPSAPTEAAAPTSEPVPDDATPAETTAGVAPDRDATSPGTTADASPAIAPVSEASPAETPAAATTEGDTSVVARFGNGITFRTADERFTMTMRLRVQVRGTLLTDQPGQDDGSLSAEIRRLRLNFQGNFFGPDWQYYVQLGFSNGDTERDLRLVPRDAYITWSHVRDANIRFGQGKVPFSRQRVNSSSSLQMVDRSLSTAEFNLDRDVGIQAFSNDLGGVGSRLGYSAGVYVGDGRNRLGTDYGLLYVARLQYSPFGRFEDLVEGDLGRETRPRLAIQVAGAYNQNSIRARSTFDATYVLGGFDFVHANADLLFKMRGFSFHAETIYRGVIGTRQREAQIDGEDVTETARIGLGYHVQAGYMFTDNLEMVGRFGQVRPLGNVTDITTRSELGGGLNWYFQQHNFKMQADYFWLAGDEFDQGRHQVRFQAQVYL